jgi:DNA-binding MarR family transcriptional regulator
VRRASDADDGRCAPIRLTAKGAALEKAALEAYVESADELMDALPKAELSRVDAALEILLERFEPDENQARPGPVRRTGARAR